MKYKKNTRFFILALILSILWILPLYWALATSLKTDTEIYGGITLIPHSPTLENYRALLEYKDGVFLTYIRNSVELCLIVVICVCIVSVLAGFAMSKLELYGKKIWTVMLLLTMMIPITSIMVPLYQTMSNLHLLGTIWGMVALFVTFQTPFCVFMMKNSFDMIPNELLDAARVDGANSFDLFKSIFLPLALPGVITVAVYSAYSTWNDYVTGLTFGGNTMKTYNVGLVNMLSSDRAVGWGTLTSGAIVGMLPILILFLFLQKYFIAGMMSGSVK